MMDLERAVRRAKTQSLFVLTLTVLLSGLAIGYSYRLGEANAELEEMKTRLSKVTPNTPSRLPADSCAAPRWTRPMRISSNLKHTEPGTVRLALRTTTSREYKRS